MTSAGDTSSRAVTLREARSTVAVGKPAPVFGQVQWSVDVVLGAQKLMYKSLLGKLKNVPHDHLIEKINSITDLKKATGIMAGLMYVMPPMSFIATVLSTSYLKKSASDMTPGIPDRLSAVDMIIRAVDGRGGPGAGDDDLLEMTEALEALQSHRRPMLGMGRL